MALLSSVAGLCGEWCDVSACATPVGMGRASWSVWVTTGCAGQWGAGQAVGCHAVCRSDGDMRSTGHHADRSADRSCTCFTVL